MNLIRIENIQHMYINGKASTLFDVYVSSEDIYGNEVWVFDRKDSVKGTVKRESTILKRLNA